MYSGLCTILDFPTGRPLLSGRHRTSSYKRSIASLGITCGYTDALREDMADVLSLMDQAHKLNPDENWRLACKCLSHLPSLFLIYIYLYEIE